MRIRIRRIPDADPDFDFLFDADPDPDPISKKRRKPLKKCFIHFGLTSANWCGSGFLFDADPGYQNDSDPDPKHCLWPAWSVTLGSAPWRSSCCTRAASPRLAAWCSGVSPTAFRFTGGCFFSLAADRGEVTGTTQSAKRFVVPAVLRRSRRDRPCSHTTHFHDHSRKTPNSENKKNWTSFLQTASKHIPTATKPGFRIRIRIRIRMDPH